MAALTPITQASQFGRIWIASPSGRHTNFVDYVATRLSWKRCGFRGSAVNETGHLFLSVFMRIALTQSGRSAARIQTRGWPPTTSHVHPTIAQNTVHHPCSPLIQSMPPPQSMHTQCVPSYTVTHLRPQGGAHRSLGRVEGEWASGQPRRRDGLGSPPLPTAICMQTSWTPINVPSSFKPTAARDAPPHNWPHNWL